MTRWTAFRPPLARALVALLGVTFLHVALSGAAMAQAYTYQPFDYPGAVSTSPFAINNAGHIAGTYALQRGGGNAFLYDGANFVSIDIQDAVYSSAEGINDAGTVVGWYRDKAGDTHGFTYENGVATRYDVSIPGAVRTVLTDISSGGTLAGWFDPGSGDPIGFVDKGGTVTQIGQSYTGVNGINNAGRVVGVHRPGTATNRGFLYHNGSFRRLPPARVESQAWDINNAGHVVGDYRPSGRLGFLYDGRRVISFDFPGDGDEGTALYGINDRGVVVGSYFTTAPPGFGTSRGFIAFPARAGHRSGRHPRRMTNP
ncbi:hypothetical protein SVA_1812 [Sulfurifustis variabilis]|uniref:Uncharacterized protein n=1 Tax=Sulfurifustis variabilis TaxID=1675686 RepID=A0A1B4V4C0_9GAMM|nr:hypothetical protein [Sulfurifustis variabilis]BAU48366.1 hypothetical protein SVA_1812 [Sulfurifustis variabilis]